MSELSMSPTEREAFLAADHVAVIAVERDDGPPLLTPVWYRYTNGLVLIATNSASTKAQLMQTGGVVSLCVQREAHPPAYVTVDGPVEFAPAAPDDVLQIAARYLDDEAAHAFVDSGADDIIVTLTPSRWFSTDFAKLAG